MITRPYALLYIHGFNSSPQSHKAQLVAEYVRAQFPEVLFIAPQVHSYPLAAKQQLIDIVEQYSESHQIILIGSSLGGYLSTWLNDCYGFKSVLVNPAVKPYELLVDYLGEQTNPYTKESYRLNQQHIEELRTLDVLTIKRPSQLWLLQQMGDEVLDYRQAVEKYHDCKMSVEEGGDHSFQGFEGYLQQIMQFLMHE